MKRQLPKPKNAAVLSLVKTDRELGPVEAVSESSVNEMHIDGQLLPRTMSVGGSTHEPFNIYIVEKTANASLSVSSSEDAEELQKRVGVVAAALAAFKATDEIEAMLAAQAVALHFGAMEALRRSVIVGQPAEIAARLRKDGANMARTFTDMLLAFDRKRGKTQQVVRVEQVVVNDGGQAIVGTVNAGQSGPGGRA